MNAARPLPLAVLVGARRHKRGAGKCRRDSSPDNAATAVPVTTMADVAIGDVTAIDTAAAEASGGTRVSYAMTSRTYTALSRLCRGGYGCHAQAQQGSAGEQGQYFSHD
jgi:hypothetical protein